MNIHLFSWNYLLRFLLRYKGSNTGKRERQKNLKHPRERFLLPNEAPPSWRPIEIFPAGVWDFSVLPSYRCLILFSLIFYWKYSIFLHEIRGDTYFDLIEEWRQRYGKGHLEIRKNENKRHKYIQYGWILYLKKKQWLNP